MIHPIAIWAWAFALAILQSRSTTLSILIISTIIFISFFRFRQGKSRSLSDQPNPIQIAIYFALFAAVIRLIFGIIIGVPQSGNILFTLPNLPLPNWLAGITIGGAVSLERLQLVGIEILKFSAVLVTFAFATSVTSVNQLIRIFIRRFRSIGTAMLIALSLIPQLIISIQRIKIAQRMRGIKRVGFRNWQSIAAPVIEESLDRAIDLAANLESKGFGYHQNPTTFKAIKMGLSELSILAAAMFFLLLSMTDLTLNLIFISAVLISIFSTFFIWQSNQNFINNLLALDINTESDRSKNQIARSAK